MADKMKVALSIDADVMLAAHVRAARTNRSDSELVEDALRAYLGFDLMTGDRDSSVLTEDPAMAIAIEVTHEVRAERRATLPVMTPTEFLALLTRE